MTNDAPKNRTGPPWRANDEEINFGDYVALNITSDAVGLIVGSHPTRGVPLVKLIVGPNPGEIVAVGLAQIVLKLPGPPGGPALHDLPQIDERQEARRIAQRLSSSPGFWLGVALLTSLILYVTGG